MKYFVLLTYTVGLFFLITSDAVAETVERDWSGLTLGAIAGYSTSRAGSDGTANNDAGGGYWATVDIPTVAEATDEKLIPDSRITGLEVGFSNQSGRLVTGIDAGAYFFNADDSTTEFRPYPTNATGFTIKSDIDTNWLFTLAPKVGVAFGDILLELNGGLAITKIKTSVDLVQEVNNRTAFASNTEIAPGYLIGASMSYAFTDHWSLRAKYQYIDFRGVSATARLFNGTTDAGSFIKQDYNLDTHAMTLGLIFHF